MPFERLRALYMQDSSLYLKNLPSPIDARFGNLGFPVGAMFESRKALTSSGLHVAPFAGISGTKDGAFSVVISGGYSDDDDHGDYVIYTGTGGQINSFSGPTQHVQDQTFDHRHNRALLKSVETQRPVRVIRGHGAGKYAPTSGYRFDGMYVVEDAYLEKGSDGFAICRFRLRRVPGQSPIAFHTRYTSPGTQETTAI